jgi:hypothetical protein
MYTDVHMYICIYIYIWYIYTYMHVWSYINMCACVHIYIKINTHLATWIMHRFVIIGNSCKRSMSTYLELFARVSHHLTLLRATHLRQEHFGAVDQARDETERCLRAHVAELEVTSSSCV